MLSVQAIDTFYGSSQALFQMTMEVASGEVVTLLGRNGMGKTTTVNSIMGIVPARRGRIVFEGAELQDLEAYRSARAGRYPHRTGQGARERCDQDGGDVGHAIGNLVDLRLMSHERFAERAARIPTIPRLDPGRQITACHVAAHPPQVRPPHVRPVV